LLRSPIFAYEEKNFASVFTECRVLDLRVADLIGEDGIAFEEGNAGDL
jgi:hypothetical protein